MAFNGGNAGSPWEKFLTSVAHWLRDSIFRRNRCSRGEMWLNRQTDRQTGRQTDRQTHTHTHTHTQTTTLCRREPTITAVSDTDCNKKTANMHKALYSVSVRGYAYMQEHIPVSSCYLCKAFQKSLSPHWLQWVYSPTTWKHKEASTQCIFIRNDSANSAFHSELCWNTFITSSRSASYTQRFQVMLLPTNVTKPKYLLNTRMLVT